MVFSWRDLAQSTEEDRRNELKFQQGRLGPAGRKRILHGKVFKYCKGQNEEWDSDNFRRCFAQMGSEVPWRGDCPKYTPTS